MNDETDEELVNVMIAIIWPLLDAAEDVASEKGRLECAFNNAMDSWEPPG